MAIGNGGKVLMIIAPEQFRDEELLVPRDAFIAAGYEVTVACEQLGTAKGMLGATFKPDAIIKDVNDADYQAIVVVGGMGSPQYLWQDQDLHKLLKQMQSDNKVVSAICLSGAVLAKAGVLSGKQATVWPMPESLEALKSGQAKYLEQPVVQDGRVITANGPEAAAEFAQTIIKELSRMTSRV